MTTLSRHFSGSDGCDYAGGFCYCNATPASETLTTMTSATYAVPDAWSYNSSSPSWDAPSSWYGADIRIRVYKGGSAPVLLDHVRVYEY